MPISVRTIAREFTPAEAAAITGVSVAHQRDWRRRKLIAEKEGSGWTRFDVNSIIDLAVLGFFTRMGFAPSSLSFVRHMAVLPTLAGIMANADGYEVVGDEIDPAIRDCMIHGTVCGDTTYILVVTPGDEEMSGVVRVKSYDDVQKVLEAENLPNCAILDCHMLASHLIQKTCGPLFRIEVEAE